MACASLLLIGMKIARQPLGALRDRNIGVKIDEGCSRGRQRLLRPVSEGYRYTYINPLPLEKAQLQLWNHSLHHENELLGQCWGCQHDDFTDPLSLQVLANPPL